MSSSDDEVSLLDETSQQADAADDDDDPMTASDEDVTVARKKRKDADNGDDDDDNEDENEEEDDDDDDNGEQTSSQSTSAARKTKSKPKPVAAKAKKAKVSTKTVSAAADDDEEDDDDEDEDDEPDDEEEEEEPPSFAAALGLHRVGSKLPARPQSQQPVQVLNARGMPARIRKKNKLFFDDDTIVNERPQRVSPSKRATAQQQQAAQRSSTGESSKNTSSSAATAGTASKASAVSPQKTPSKLLKKRKTVVSRYMKIKEAKRVELEREREAARVASANAAAATASSTTNTTATKSTSAVSASNGLSAAPATATSHPQIDRKCFERDGLRLRNLLKLPKAHKWVSYEWFYSYVDRPLFDGPNDFQICLSESFPQLRSRQLTRAEWSHIRTLMGKPRRCSPAFFAEERAELERRRHKIRVLQSHTQRKQLGGDAEFVRHLPAEIPLALPIGTKVTARLRQPQDGIFTGSVDVVDSVNSTYRITFDRPGLGTHSVPDFEIMANDYAEMLPLASVVGQDAGAVQRGKPGPGSTSGSGRKAAAAAAAANSNRNDPLLGSEIFNNSKLKALVSGGGGGVSASGSSAVGGALKPTIGGFHLKLLELMIRTRKTLVAKEMKLLRLKNMNAEAEMCRSFDEPLPDDYQRRYASIVIGMEKLNRDMHVSSSHLTYISYMIPLI